jgi:hypothetical protein
MLELIRVGGGQGQGHLQDRGASEGLDGIHHQVLEDGIATVANQGLAEGDADLLAQLVQVVSPRLR